MSRDDDCIADGQDRRGSDRTGAPTLTAPYLQKASTVWSIGIQPLIPAV
jgi:hypothetical protein